MLSDSPFGRPARVLIVEDHRSYRIGLKMDLEPFSQEVNIIGEAANAKEALDFVTHHGPHVVLVDLLLPLSRAALSEPKVEHGLQLIRRIRELAPNTRILVLSSVRENPSVVEQVREAGAHGYIAKDEDRSGAQLVTAIREVMQTGRLRSYGLTIERHVHNLKRLTPREREVLALVAEGWSNEEIRQQLGIGSEKTVRQHVHNIFVKLDVTSRDTLLMHHGRPE